MNTEKERIRNVNAWPLWPRLPVKKPTLVGFRDLGYIMADDVAADGPITLHKANVFGTSRSEATQKFESLDALLEAGWVGD